MTQNKSSTSKYGKKQWKVRFFFLQRNSLGVTHTFEFIFLSVFFFQDHLLKIFETLYFLIKIFLTVFFIQTDFMFFLS